jgi:hypothetical protein
LTEGKGKREAVVLFSTAPACPLASLSPIPSNAGSVARDFLPALFRELFCSAFSAETGKFVVFHDDIVPQGIPAEADMPPLTAKGA